MRQLRVGIIGTGNIFARYVTGMRSLPGLEVAACADVNRDAARARALELGIPRAASVDELIADPAVDVIVNLTPPTAHEQVNLAVIAAGKHVFSEKPLATGVDGARKTIQAAEAAGVLLGCAPEVFLGSAGQTARRAIDDGLIGEPIGATAFVEHTRIEEWHPAPGPFFSPGGGPALDMGPYPLSALVNCLGPVERVVAMSRIGSPVRSVTSVGRDRDEVDVTVATHDVGALRFAGGAMASVMLSFDAWPATDGSRTLPWVEIYGTRGTLSLPNPDITDGDVRFRGPRDAGWQVLTPVLPTVGPAGLVWGGFRGLGIADLQQALEGGSHRTSGRLALHLLEVELALTNAGPDGTIHVVENSCDRPDVVTRW